MTGKLDRTHGHERIAALSLLIGYTLGVAVYNFLGADAFDVVLLQLAFLPWLVGPAALATFLAFRADARWCRRSYLIAEVVVILSTIAFWTWLYLHPDAQNGIGILFFPAVQFAAILIYALLLAIFASIR